MYSSVVFQQKRKRKYCSWHCYSGSSIAELNIDLTANQSFKCTYILIHLDTWTKWLQSRPPTITLTSSHSNSSQSKSIVAFVTNCATPNPLCGFRIGCVVESPVWRILQLRTLRHYAITMWDTDNTVVCTRDRPMWFDPPIL